MTYLVHYSAEGEHVGPAYMHYYDFRALFGADTMTQSTTFERPAEEQRTVDDKINRLRARIKQAVFVDANVRALLLGILDLLGDEL